MEAMEQDRVRPRQVRYQAALRPDPKNPHYLTPGGERWRIAPTAVRRAGTAVPAYVLRPN
jgi:hypothetical protein